jgi:cell division protease FtsH
VATFVLILVIGASVLRARAAANGGGIMGVAKSPGRRVDELGDKVPKVKFADVAGCDEAVKELRRVVNGLVGRDVYASFDADLPGGILLVGPPGTGKTLLAKATAGESKGTMDILSGSDFVFMLVGVGAGRVRDAFAVARKAVEETGKPHIIFIDEIDAVGGKRGGGVASSGGNQEREQTLNQLLVEMDGVQTNRGILLMAATNRVDMLDEALLRPGRFDCQVRVDLPDRKGREAIFAIHLRKKPLHEEVTLAGLASRSYGYSGAEIKGACNRAAIIAAERWYEQTQDLRAEKLPEDEIAKRVPKAITLKDFDEGIDFVRHGNAEPGKQANMTAEQKENTAGHEAGHACSSDTVEGSDPVVKITILRRARALGYVQYMPDGDRITYTMKEAVARIITSLAGRAAQEELFGVKDAGASNDFEQANNLARTMVTRWGMSRLGHIFVGEAGASPLPGMGGSGLACGAALADEIDAEVRRIVDACYQIARKIARADKERIKKLTAILMEQETMLADEWLAFVRDNPSTLTKADVAFDPTAPEVTQTEGK